MKFCDRLYWLGCIDQAISATDALSGYSDALLTETDVEFRESALLKAQRLIEIFVQQNFTGPPLDSPLSDILDIPMGAFLDPTPIETFLDDLDFSANLIFERESGEDVFPLLKFSPCLLIARFILESLVEYEDSSIWLARSLFIQQRVCSFASDSLESRLSEVLRTCDDYVADKDDQYKAEFLLFKAVIKIYYHKEKSAALYLQQAQEQVGLKWRMTGKLGKRTKFQQFDVAQLTLEVSKDNSVLPVTAADTTPCFPNTLQLGDDTLLDEISFADSSNVDYSSLQPLDHCILLAICQDYRLRNPKDEITAEQMYPFLDCVISNPANFSIHTLALYTRSRLDSTRKRKVERAILQIQALVDQFPIVDSEVGGADAAVRKKYFWQLLYPLKTEMQSDLGKMFLEYGMSRSALDIYLPLERWEEVIHCYIMMDEFEKAEKCVLEQLEKTNVSKPKLLCIMGDLKNDSSYYEKAWEVSECRYARAMRSLGASYFKESNYASAMKCYEKALAVNSLFENAWFTYGCASMQVEDWDKAQVAFTRCVQLEEGNGEAWNNLAAIYIKMDKKVDALKCLKVGLKEKYENWKMWENVLYLALDIRDPSEAIHSVNRLLDLTWKDRANVDIESIDVLVKLVISLSVEKHMEGTSSRLKSTLERVTSMHTMVSQLWIIKSSFHRFEGDIAETLKSLQSANRACQCAADKFYEEENFKKAFDVALMLADAYCEAESNQIVADGAYQSRLLLRKLLKQGKECFEGDDLYRKLQMKYEEVQKNKIGQ